MSLLIVLIIAMAAGLTGIAIGWFLRFIISLGKRGSMELEIKEMLLSAREEAERITSEAEVRADKTIATAKQEAKEIEEKAEKTEERLIAKEHLLDRRQMDIDEEADELKEQMQHAEEQIRKNNELEQELIKKMESVTNLSHDEAVAQLLDRIEEQHKEDMLIRLQKLQSEGRVALQEKAQEILATAIHRLGNEIPADIFSSIVDLPSEDIKGKIIGKEGRNIKTFERATGVEIIIDDTPSVVTLSSFDPVRRHIAKTALEALIAGSKIQPVTIEKEIEKANKKVQTMIKEEGEKAAYECGVFNLDPKLITILGRLYFRTSYGQNVLRHSVEMAHIAGMLAEELGADVKIAKAGALLHDIGKAVDHEVPGTHVEIGRRILQKFNVDEAIIKAMQAHHEEYEYETVESIIVQVADAISGGRPGARRDTVENYLKRLDELETIAKNFDGVEKAYALEAGREIRVFVSPEKITDLQAQKLARDIAVKIEKDLRYPGEIKVHVIREQRIVEFAR